MNERTRYRREAWYAGQIAKAERAIVIGQDIARRACILHDGLMLAHGDHLVCAAFEREAELKTSRLQELGGKR